MARFLEWLVPGDQRALIGWATLSATVALLLNAAVSQASWRLELLTDPAFELFAVPLAVAALSFFLTGYALRRGAPPWIWLGPAVAAISALLSPVIVLAGFGPDEFVARFVLEAWFAALTPTIVLLVPSLAAVTLESKRTAILLPPDERQEVVRLAAFALSVLVVNSIAFEIANGGFSWLLGPMRDDQALNLFWIVNSVGPALLGCLFTATRLVPRSAWIVIAVPAMAFSLIGFIGGPGLFLLYLVFMATLSAGVFAGCVLGAWIRGLLDARSPQPSSV